MKQIEKVQKLHHLHEIGSMLSPSYDSVPAFCVNTPNPAEQVRARITTSCELHKLVTESTDWPVVSQAVDNLLSLPSWRDSCCCRRCSKQRYRTVALAHGACNNKTICLQQGCTQNRIKFCCHPNILHFTPTVQLTISAHTYNNIVYRKYMNTFCFFKATLNHNFKLDSMLNL